MSLQVTVEGSRAQLANSVGMLESVIDDPLAGSSELVALLRRRLPLAAKRAGDIAVAGLLLFALLPVLLVIALAIKFDSPGPVFHRVRRMGYRGQAFDMLKFRKMHHNAVGGPLTAARDHRLTRIGAVLTKTRLDELPQLWDVLRGRMSLIGPRPEDPRFVMLQRDAYRMILQVRPGITGITQLAFSSESAILNREDPVSDYVERILPRKVELDLLYATRLSPRLDLSVLCWTLRTALTGVDVAVNRADGRITVRAPRTALPARVPAAPLVEAA